MVDLCLLNSISERRLFECGGAGTAARSFDHLWRLCVLEAQAPRISMVRMLYALIRLTDCNIK